MNKHFLLTWLMLGCVLLTLDGCGFRLRGGAGVALSMPATYVAGDTASPALLSELRQNLMGAGVVLVDKRENSRAILTITGEEKSRRVLSVGAAGTAQEYELRYAVTFMMSDHAGVDIVPSQTIARLRAVSFDESQVLAKGAEAELLYRDLRRDVVQGMVRRLSAVDKTVDH